jgi:hypothetical protein
MSFYLLILPQSCVIAIYAPMIHTAPYVMFFMCADPLRWQVAGGLGPENQDIFGPCEMALSRYVSDIWGPKKVEPFCSGGGGEPKGKNGAAKNILKG